MAFMSFQKKGLSALGIQRQLGHERYNTIWGLMHKMEPKDKLMSLLWQSLLILKTLKLDKNHFIVCISK
jgi:hypothetical protein